MMDSSATLLSPVAPWELPPQTGAEAAGLADLRAMLAELSDASLERILFESAGKPEEEGAGAAPKTTSSSPSVVAEARKAGQLDALLQRHLADVINVERLAWSGDGGDRSTFRGKPPSPASVRVVASSAGGEEAASKTTPSSGGVAPATSPRSSIARWWANRKTVIGRKGRKAAAKEAAAAVKEAAATETTSSSAAAIIFAREAAVALSSSDTGVAGAAAWAVTRWLSLHPAHWRALLDAGCVAPLVELLMNNASAAPSSAAANAAASSANAAGSLASSAAAATSTTSNINNSLNDDAPAAACAALALRAIASSGPDAQAAAAAAGAVGAAVDALEAVEDDGLWTGLAAVEEEEEEEEEQEKEGEGEQRGTKSNDNNENDNDDASCSSPRSPSSFPSPPVPCSKKKKKASSSSLSNPLLAHRRAQQEALASLIGALTAGNEAVALAATAAGCLPRLLALLSPSRNYSPALAACALFSLQPLAQVPGVRARLLLLDEGGRSSSAGNTNNGSNSNSNNNEERNPVALVTGSLRRLTGVSGATRAAAMLLLSLLTETEREKEDHDGRGEQHQQKRFRERERERSVFLRWMAEADTPGELVRVLQPWALAPAEEEAGSSSKNSSAPSTPLSSKQEGTTQPRQLSAATVAAVCSALAAISRSGDRRCAALLFTASCDDPAVLRGVVRRAATAPSAARSARVALEALGEASEEDDGEDDFDGEGEEEKLTEEELAKMAEARERAATYFL